MSGAEVSVPLSAGRGGASPLSEPMPPILTLTVNPTVDICYEVDRLAGIGKTRARVRHVAAGGGGINVARGLSRLGGRATAVHTAGREVGRRLNRLLDEEGVDHLALGIAGETREAFVLFETETRRSYHIVPPGPRLDDGEGRRLVDALGRAAGSHHYVVASGSLPSGLPDAFYAAVARRVKEAGARLVLDTSGGPCASLCVRASFCEGATITRPPPWPAGPSGPSTTPVPSTSTYSPQERPRSPSPPSASWVHSVRPGTATPSCGPRRCLGRRSATPGPETPWWPHSPFGWLRATIRSRLVPSGSPWRPRQCSPRTPNRSIERWPSPSVPRCGSSGKPAHDPLVPAPSIPAEVDVAAAAAYAALHSRLFTTRCCAAAVRT